MNYSDSSSDSATILVGLRVILEKAKEYEDECDLDYVLYISGYNECTPGEWKSALYEINDSCKNSATSVIADAMIEKDEENVTIPCDYDGKGLIGDDEDADLIGFDNDLSKFEVEGNIIKAL